MRGAVYGCILNATKGLHMHRLLLIGLVALAACSNPFGGGFNVRMVFAPGFPFKDGAGVCQIKWRVVASDSGEVNPRHVTLSITDDYGATDLTFTGYYPSAGQPTTFPGWVYAGGPHFAWLFEADGYSERGSIGNVC